MVSYLNGLSDKVILQLNEELKEKWHNLERDLHHTCFNSLAWIENYISSHKETQDYSKLRIFIITFKDKPVCILLFEIIKKFIN